MSEEKFPTIQKLMDQAYDRWRAADGMGKQDFWDQLDAAEKIAVFAGNLNYQVENGGFMQWIDNGYATIETVGFLLRLNLRLKTESAMAVSVLLDQVEAALGRIESDGNDYAAVLRDADEYDYEMLMDVFDPLDSFFYNVNEAWLADVELHVASLVMDKKAA